MSFSIPYSSPLRETLIMSKTGKREPRRLGDLPSGQDAKREPRILFFKSHIVGKDGKPILKPSPGGEKAGRA